ncbi:MAG TPA: GFA family protein [Steroidobacteraceae bacterium]
MSLSGGCLCGAVRYESSADPVFSGHCYCTDCQKESGCGHTTVAAVPDAAFRITGATAGFSKLGGSGQATERTFCVKCGTTLFSRPVAAAGLTILRAGTLDDTSQITPGMSIYASRARAWDPPPAHIPAFAEMPPRR